MLFVHEPHFHEPELCFHILIPLMSATILNVLAGQLNWQLCALAVASKIKILQLILSQIK